MNNLPKVVSRQCGHHHHNHHFIVNKARQNALLYNENRTEWKMTMPNKTTLKITINVS